MTPGEYLQKRRAHAGLTLAEVARQLALLQFGAAPRVAIGEELVRAEASQLALSLAQAQTLRSVFPLDPSIYESLAMRHFADPTLPAPRVCTSCACSWNDPCRIHARRGTSVIDWPCSWSMSMPEICTACEIARVTAEAIRAATGREPALSETETLLTLTPVHAHEGRAN